MSLRLALFASGTGSNALNLLETARTLKNVEFSLIVVDQTASPLPLKVKELYPDLPVVVIPMGKETDRKIRKQNHERAILAALKVQRIDWIFLAGYMRIVGPTLLDEYSAHGRSRIVNIHPSLLPAYPGLHAFERTFESGDAFGGVTVHLVDAGMDTGPVVAQEKFVRKPNDTLSEFIDRGKILEWSLYANVLKQLDKQGNL